MFSIVDFDKAVAMLSRGRQDLKDHEIRRNSQAKTRGEQRAGILELSVLQFMHQAHSETSIS